jgi:type VI secretion system protein VasG
MIDNIITNTLLPSLSREFLKRALAKEPPREAKVMIENENFAYAWT